MKRYADDLRAFMAWFARLLTAVFVINGQVLKRVHPRVHLYGHVHDANGAVFNDGTLFINSAMDLDPTVHVVDVEVRVQPATGE